MESLAGLRVGVDARLHTPAGTGVATYRDVLIRTLADLGVRVELICDDPAPGLAAFTFAEGWVAAARTGERRLRTRLEAEISVHHRIDLFREAQRHFNLHGRLMELACDDPPDVMHWTYPLPMRLVGSRNVYTVHDAIPVTHPHLTGIAPRRYRRLIRRIEAAADLIVTVSESSQREIESLMPKHEGRVVNTYQSIRPPSNDVPPPLDLPVDGYLLVCGSVEPRKNIPRILSAYARSGVRLPLVIAGPDGWRATRAYPREMAQAGVIRLMWTERDALIGLVRGARALLFPSLAEGFGLPALEAMSLGTPVLTSNRGALAEVAGEATLAVDPEDTDALAGAIAAIATDSALSQRLRQAGLTQARRFSVTAYGERLTDAYRRLPIAHRSLGGPT